MSAEPVGLWVEGRAATWDLDRDGEVIEARAFDRSIADYLKNGVVAYSHAKQIMDTVAGPSSYVQIGVTTDLRRVGGGLLWKAWLPRPSSGFLRDVWEQVRAGVLKGISVGGKFFKTIGSNRIDRIDLQEISLAPKPVNPAALVTSVTEAFEVPELSSCGEACALRIGSTGKADPGAVDLSAALELEQLAQGLREVRGHLAANRRTEAQHARDELRRELARLQVWTV